jgi:acyl-CoA thioester hydrolase
MDHKAEDLKFPVKLDLRIDWAELDLFGHVNNVMFLKYVQASRVYYWEQIGLYQHFLETKLGPMVASVNCQFKKPMHYPGQVTILIRMKYIRNTSFSLQYRILDGKGETAAEAEDVIVMYDFNNNHKIPFPEEFRKMAEELEGRTLTIEV